MNSRQKIVQQQFLNDEAAVLRLLYRTYTAAAQDIAASIKGHYDAIDAINQQIAALDPSDPQVAILMSKRQSQVYQKQYQEALFKQVSDILDKLKTKQYLTVAEYLANCYDEGFLGALFDLHGQGIPLAIPINQQAIAYAVQLNSKISKGLYTRLGEDVEQLKKKIASEVSRMMATGQSYTDCAKSLASISNTGYNNAMRIARTEGHRVQMNATMDAATDAKERGADLVKQWDATLDARTRDSHVAIDGEIRELEEKFSNGLMYPSDPSGRPEEVINCRCALLQISRDSIGGSFTKRNNFDKSLMEFQSPEEYAAFKEAFFSKENKEYMNFMTDLEKKYKVKNVNQVVNRMNKAERARRDELLSVNPLYKKR